MHHSRARIERAISYGEETDEDEEVMGGEGIEEENLMGEGEVGEVKGGRYGGGCRGVGREGIWEAA